MRGATSLGFKKLTIDNWLEPDRISSSFVRISPADGQVHAVNGEDYVRAILGPKLIGWVPSDVRKLFEVARGALMYGYFFYPLYTLAAEQLFRVMETAASLKCKAMRAPSNVRTFERKIEYLCRKEVISERQEARWHAARKLRNIASHPERQSIYLPGPAIGILERVADQVNSLFSSA